MIYGFAGRVNSRSLRRVSLQYKMTWGVRLEPQPHVPVHPLMNQNQASGLLGSALVYAGLFSPLFTSPVKGQVDYFQYSPAEATVILVLATLALTLSMAGRFQFLPLVGIAICASLVLAFIKFQLFVSGSASRWMEKFADSPHEGINRLIQESLGMDWGWGPLIAGAVLIAAAGRLKGYTGY